MLNIDNQSLADRRSSLSQWVDRALELPDLQVRVRVHGDRLHVLCEAPVCPDAAVAIAKLNAAIREDSALPEELEGIEEVFLYGRARSNSNPDLDDANPDTRQDWTVRFKLDRAERQFDAIESSRSPQPNPAAIARDLNDILQGLSVRVKVSIDDLDDSLATGRLERRLWVLCESGYSPDPSLLARPVAVRLRELHLQGFRDAAILAQVSGESRPEWILRVDLTPPERILDEWAAWGDLEAIARRLSQSLAPQGARAIATQKDSTLHLFCRPCPREDGESPRSLSDRASVTDAIAPILETLAPRGIRTATIYGIDAVEETESEAPAWVDWLELPAATDSDRADSTMDLASQGNLDALTFLLERLLNPDLDDKLNTGGIRIQVRRKADLLHVMSEALTCPAREQVGPPIAKFSRQFGWDDIAGVRVYGRRAGQKRPLWNYGIDFVPRQSGGRETMPEFAATEDTSGPMLPQPGALVLRPDLSAASESVQREVDRLTQSIPELIRSLFCRTQLFAPAQPEANSPHQGAKAALVWGLLGVVLTLQADWVLGRLLQWRSPDSETAIERPQPWSENEAIGNERFDRSPLPEPQARQDDPDAESPTYPDVPLRQAEVEEEGVFNERGFTEEGRAPIAIDECEPDAADCPAVGATDYPTFNSQQMDEQLAIYQQYLQQVGTPDVLIVGSSRALRGVDPAMLQQELVQQGYPNLKVFNFSINGATAQVVDLLVRQLLPSDRLPEIIIWADGARAFNSGRTDVTYNAIASSQGYQQLAAGVRPIESQSDPTEDEDRRRSFFETLRASYRDQQDNLNQWVAGYSAAYERRDRLQSALQSGISRAIEASLPVATKSESAEADTEEDAKPETADKGDARIRLDGFLPLSVRFDPGVYYQNHPRVSGNYDADYASFELRGKQSVAFNALLDFTRSRDIPLAFVNLPLTDSYLDPVRREYEQKFRAHMVRLAMQEGFIFRDLSDLWPQQNQYFSDPSHLNRYGAAVVSQRIARDPMIPWSRAQQEKDGETP